MDAIQFSSAKVEAGRKWDGRQRSAKEFIYRQGSQIAIEHTLRLI